MTKRRTPITIISYTKLTQAPFITLCVSGFKAAYAKDDYVRVHPSILPTPFCDDPESAVGLIFFGLANINARHVDDLNITDLEPKPANTELKRPHAMEGDQAQT